MFPAVRRWEQTDDVLQEVLFRMSRALDQIGVQDTRHFFALSGRLIRRELIDLKRHFCGPHGLGAHHATVVSHSENSQHEHRMDQFGEARKSGLSIDQWASFHEQVEVLPADLKEVVTLLWYQGLDHEEAAAVLGVSAKT